MVLNQNDLLSYANPNYQLNASDENCNLEADDAYDDLYEGLDVACRISRRPGICNRRKYASLDPSSMGVDLDLESTPMLTEYAENNLNQTDGINSVKQERYSVDNGNSVFDSNENKNMGRKSSFLDYYISLETASRKQKNIPTFQALYSCDDSAQKSPSSLADKDYMTADEKGFSTQSDRGCHTQASFTEDSSSVLRKKGITSNDEKSSSLLNIPVRCSGSSNTEQLSYSESADSDALPTGWEKHEDDSGPYYWHISSGTIQREPPIHNMDCNRTPTRMSKDLDLIPVGTEFCMNSCKTSSCAVNIGNDTPHNNILNIHSVDEKLKRRSCPDGTCSLTPDKRPIRFAVRSLGWVEIAEADLTPERSSKAVNKCIVDLSKGRNDILDVVGRWGDGKDLFMDLDDYSLRLMDTQDLTVLNTQPIHTIRVWGVGRDNGRDFAYVARDRATKKHMCHVFRCDIPARIIANTLRDICKKIMIERSLQRSMEKNCDPALYNPREKFDSVRGAPTRPTDLPMEQHQFQNTETSNYRAEFFPTPMEEPKKVLKVHYLGSINVTKATGVETLNDAIEQLASSIPTSEYKYVNVAVAPSTITISEPGDDGKQLAECRVRFLSFLGIGRSVKHCGFIVHTAQDDFVAHVFHCEPSSGALCKTIEAAFTLPEVLRCSQTRHRSEKLEAQKKGLGTALKSVFGTFFLTRMTKSAET